MSSLADVPLTLVESFADCERMMSWLGERRPLLGIDVETSGLSLAKDRLRLAQLGDAENIRDGQRRRRERERGQ